MTKKYKFVEPEESRQEMIKILVKGLERSLTDQEVRTIHWLGDTDYTTVGVLLDIFKELVQQIDYFKEY